MVRHRIRLIRFKLRELQIKPLKVQLGKVPRLEAISANIKLVLEVVEIVVGELPCCLGDNEVGKRLTHRENGLLFLRMVLRVGLRCGGMRSIETPTSLFTTLEQPRNSDAVSIRIVRLFAQSTFVPATERKGFARRPAWISWALMERRFCCAESNVGFLARARSTACCIVDPPAQEPAVAFDPTPCKTGAEPPVTLSG